MIVTEVTQQKQSQVAVTELLWLTPDIPYFTVGGEMPPNCPFAGGSGPPANTWFFGPTPNGASIGSAVSVVVSNVHTNHGRIQTKLGLMLQQWRRLD